MPRLKAGANVYTLKAAYGDKEEFHHGTSGLVQPTYTEAGGIRVIKYLIESNKLGLMVLKEGTLDKWHLTNRNDAPQLSNGYL